MFSHWAFFKPQLYLSFLPLFLILFHMSSSMSPQLSSDDNKFVEVWDPVCYLFTPQSPV